MWDRHYNRTADFLVIENAHAGGHLGFSNETLDRLYEDHFDSEYDREIQRSLPVLRAMEKNTTFTFLSSLPEGFKAQTRFSI